MVNVRPFSAVRPQPGLADQIASLPYDVVNSEEARKLAKENPYSYFHIDKAEIDLPENVSPYDDTVYQKAAENLASFLEKGWLVKEETPSYYLYELTMNERSQTGMVASTSIDDYIEGKIKKHEYTRPEKERDRINHMKACDANTSPIFLCCRHEEAVQSIVNQWKETHEPLFDFKSYHEVNHRGWIVDDAETIEKLGQLFADIDALYIADGHHRTESAVKVGKEKREKGENSPESDYFLSVLFPETELSIWEYNRVVNEEIPSDFFEQLAEHFEVEESENKKPKSSGQFQMYLDGRWYTLKVKQGSVPSESVERLDVSILQKNVFESIFDIQDIRTDKRIDFVGGIRGPEELEKLVDSRKWKVAFSLYPTSILDLLNVADAGEIMPPKSTWFEPKLLSGLFLHDLETK